MYTPKFSIYFDMILYLFQYSCRLFCNFEVLKFRHYRNLNEKGGLVLIIYKLELNQFKKCFKSFCDLKT